MQSLLKLDRHQAGKQRQILEWHIRVSLTMQTKSNKRGAVLQYEVDVRRHARMQREAAAWDVRCN